MTSKEARERKLKETQEVAEGWGRMIAREAFPNGPGPDMTLAEMFADFVHVVESLLLVSGPP